MPQRVAAGREGARARARVAVSDACDEDDALPLCVRLVENADGDTDMPDTAQPREPSERAGSQPGGTSGTE